MRKTLLLFFLSFIFIFSSCTINKRVYRKGIYIEHKEQSKKVDKKKNDNSTSTTPSESSGIVRKDSLVKDDQHTAVEDSIQKTIPLSDTTTVDDNGKKHHVDHSHDISIGGNNNTHTVKADEQKKVAAHKKSNYTKHHHKHHPHHKKKHKSKHGSVHHEKPKSAHHGNSSVQIHFLGWLAYWLSWLAWIMLLFAAILAKYLPLQSEGEWDLLFLVLLLSAGFALLSLIFIPLARAFDSQDNDLIDEGVKNLKIISIPLIILLLLSGGMVALYYFL